LKQNSLSKSYSSDSLANKTAKRVSLEEIKKKFFSLPDEGNLT